MTRRHTLFAGRLNHGPRALAGLLLFLALLGALAADAGAAVPGRAVIPASADVSFPFWCDWGYDWDERCYRDDSERLQLGGDADKIWRSGLRFELRAIPRDAVVTSAELRLRYDGTCVGAYKTSRRCDQEAFTIEAHRITSPDWFAEREVEFYGPYAVLVLGAREAGWATLDVTDLVAEWVSGGLPNSGLLLKLADREEQYFVGGPQLPSATFPDASLRPTLDVAYWRDSQPTHGTAGHDAVASAAGLDLLSAGVVGTRRTTACAYRPP